MALDAFELADAWQWERRFQSVVDDASRFTLAVLVASNSRHPANICVSVLGDGASPWAGYSAKFLVDG